MAFLLATQCKANYLQNNMQTFYFWNFFKQQLCIFSQKLSNKNKQRLYKIQKRPTSLFYHALLIKQNECSTAFSEQYMSFTNSISTQLADHARIRETKNILIENFWLIQHNFRIEHGFRSFGRLGKKNIVYLCLDDDTKTAPLNVSDIGIWL